MATKSLKPVLIYFFIESTNHPVPHALIPTQTPDDRSIPTDLCNWWPYFSTPVFNGQYKDEIPQMKLSPNRVFFPFRIKIQPLAQLHEKSMHLQARLLELIVHFFSSTRPLASPSWTRTRPQWSLSLTSASCNPFYTQQHF